jgi:hypothetical protein
VVFRSVQSLLTHSRVNRSPSRWQLVDQGARGLLGDLRSGCECRSRQLLAIVLLVAAVALVIGLTAAPRDAEQCTSTATPAAGCSADPAGSVMIAD